MEFCEISFTFTSLRSSQPQHSDNEASEVRTGSETTLTSSLEPRVSASQLRPASEQSRTADQEFASDGLCHAFTTSNIRYTLWSYKLILNHLLKYRTKFHYIDFVWPLTPSSLMDIWHLVSNKQVICKKCLEMAIRKKVRFLGLAQIYLFLMDKFLKKRNLWHKKVFIIG